MADFTISTNLISWVAAKDGIFGWPIDGAEADVIDTMRVGERLIPKFAQNPDFRAQSQVDYVTAICEALGLDYEEEFLDYERRVDWGAGAVPFVWTVKGLPQEDSRFPNEVPWLVVPIAQVELENPYSTGEFLRHRTLPIEIARQFKGMAAPGRHIQTLPPGAADVIEQFGHRQSRTEVMRLLSLVKEPPLRSLDEVGRDPRPGDYAFMVGEDRIAGLLRCDYRGELAPAGEGIGIPPEELPDLISRAKERATPADRFHPGNAAAAARELADFAVSEEKVREVAEFGTFYDGYMLLPKKVSQALELAERDLPPVVSGFRVEVEEDEDEDDGEQAELDNLHGLTVSAARAELPEIVLPDAVLAEAVTALRAGKHLLLSGPPGTGKSTLAAALCRAVVGAEFDVVTATADWSTFETIGGYMPKDGSGDLEFEPGLVLRALQRGRWLIVDEVNRADIDKAFGPLFTLLADSGESGSAEDVVLPYRKADRSIRIVRAERREGASSPYAMTPVWRLIGTLNARDKASLFRLSFAFLRRFALVEVPLPEPAQYQSIYEGWSRGMDDGLRVRTVEAAMLVAFGRRQLGPAILKDIADFTKIGTAVTDTASGSASYRDPVVAFLTAVRLYAVPQYEGASRADADDFLQRLRGVWDDPPQETWEALERSFDGVILS